MEDADEEKALDSAKKSGALFEPAKPQPGDFDYVEPGQDLGSPWPELGRGFDPFEEEVRSKQPAEHTYQTAAACRRPLAHTTKHAVLAFLHPASCCSPPSYALQAVIADPRRLCIGCCSAAYA